MTASISSGQIFIVIFIPLVAYVMVKKRNEVRNSSSGAGGESSNSIMDEDSLKLAKKRARLMVLASWSVALVGFLMTASHVARSVGLFLVYLGAALTCISVGVRVSFTVSGKPAWLARR